MPPTKACSCKEHDNLKKSTGKIQIQNIKTCKKFKKSVLTFLISKGFLEAHHNFLCIDCYDYGLCEVDSKKHTVKELCDLINDDNINESDMSLLCSAIGEKFKRTLRKIPAAPYMESVKDLNADKQLENIDPDLYTFLSALSSEPHEQKVQILNAYEHISNLSNSYYIGPLNFALNILFHYITGSKQVLEMRSKYSPSGSYTKALQYTALNSKTPNKFEQSRDSVIVFDNNQLLSRSWDVKLNSKALISVITTIACLVPPDISYHQNNPALSPFKWIMDTSKVIPSNVEHDKLVRMHRNCYIDETMKSVADILNYTNGPSQAKKAKVENDALKCVKKSTNDPYDSVESCVTGKTEIHVLDPVMVNPCSFVSLATVLDSFIQNKTTEWIAVVCDGLPFHLCSKMMDNYFVCATCKLEFKKKKDFQDHQSVHPAETNIYECLKYGQILLLPGIGHMEINITKAMFKLLWEICLKELAILLGWKSLKALTACYNCTDHHKAWQILQIFYKASSHALIELYVKECMKNNEESSVQGLYVFYQKQTRVYVILFKCTFSYMHALNMFRTAVRRGNFVLMYASLNKLSTLFYGMNMTTYMELNYRMDKLIQSAPPSVLEFITNTICLSQSGHPSKAEGCDFILETVNKKIKAWLPPGIPTEERWTRVCRNLSSMEQMKKCVQNKLTSDTISDEPSPYFRSLKHEDAVHALQQKLMPYLKQPDLVSINGDTILDEELINFDMKCEQNKRNYYATYPNTEGMEKIFVTVEDRSRFFDITNKTKAEIQKSILNIIEQIEGEGGEEEAEVLNNQWVKEIKCGTKHLYLTFYKEVVQTLEQVTGQNRKVSDDDSCEPV